MKRTVSCSILISAVFLLLWGFFVNSAVWAGEILEPGWFSVTAGPVNHQEAQLYYKQKTKTSIQSRNYKDRTKSGMSAYGDSSGSGIAAEITELARALQHNPKLIYEYVHNNIDYVPYFGALKGPLATLLDRSGNDFDQASLMIELLRVSGWTARYVYGQMYIPNYNFTDNHDMRNWLGVDYSSTVLNILSSGGIPANLSGGWTVMDRVWVKAVINDKDYLFDPAFKIYKETPKIDLAQAMGYKSNEFIAAAGGEAGADYVRNLNDSGLRLKLAEYSMNLVNFLRVNYPNAHVDEIIGKREIVPEYLTDLPIALPFSNTAVEYWDNIPDAYIHKVKIKHGGIDKTFSIPDAAGKRLAITYDTGQMSTAAFSRQKGVLKSLDAEPVSTLDIKTVRTLPGKVVKLFQRQHHKEGISTRDYHGAVDFGRVSSSGTVTWSISFTNPNPAKLTVSCSLEGNTGGAYSFISGGETRTISQGESYGLIVQFSGANQSRGTKTASLSLTAAYPGQTSQVESWDFSGFVAADPDLTGSYGIDFGRRYCGDLAEATAVLKNNGAVDIMVLSLIT